MNWEADVALAAHTRYRIGGPAARFGRVESTRELAGAIAAAGEAPRVLGWGANVLVADAGVSEAVLLLEGEFDFVRLMEETVDAGAACGIPSMIGEVRRAGRSGYDFLEAVPGTIGGALRMNAGSAEIGIWDRVIWAEVMKPDGRIIRLTPDEARPSYRSIQLPSDWVFTSGRFKAPKGDAREINRTHLARRRTKVETQVYDQPTCGSIWKNPGPPHGSAWQVVEAVGMRGASHGGARIAEKHANFIVNADCATAADVVWLMQETRRRAADIGADLEPEICLWGFEPDDIRDVGGRP